MRLPHWPPKLWRFSALAAFFLLLSIDRPLAQPSHDPDPSGATVSEPAPLPPAIRKTLDVALDREERAKKIGTIPARSFPLKVCIAGKCGAINRDGTFAIALAYDWIDTFSEGRAAMRVHDRYNYLYGFVDDVGRVMWKPQFQTADRFSRGFAQIDVEGKSGLIDRDGQVVVWPRFGFVVPFSNGIFWVTEEREIFAGNNEKQKFLFEMPRISLNGISDTDVMPKGKWGVIDRSGAWIRQPEFLAIRVFNYADSSLMWAKTDAGWGLIRPDMTWQVEPKYEDVGQIKNGLAGIKLNGRFGYVDSFGTQAIEPRFEHAQEFKGSYAAAKANNLFGLIDRTGAWAIEPKYDMISSNGIILPESWWATKHAGKFGVLDDALREIISPQLEQSAAMCTDGRILSFAKGKPMMFSRDGAPLDDDKGCDSMISERRN